ncbi:MAG: thioredoxin family protein, partial [Solimonas sp.]
GSKSVEPGVHEALVARYGDPGLKSREISVGNWDDPLEACFERGWTDGLPVVPPTDERILRMLGGTTRKPDEVVGLIPPNLAPCTVEKVAINAVMAGCKPEYMPVVLGVLEAALDPLFVLHGLLCTTHFSGPLVIINGPVAKAIGMNSGTNALGQGNRANATIGRALQLIVRNVGGGLPGAIDRATLGNPGKYTFCFAEDESDPDWEPLSVRRGIAPGKSAVTLFHGEGVNGFIDQKSRTPEELVRSLAMGLFGVGHPKLCLSGNAVLVVAPEHYKIFKDGGWNRRRIEDELFTALKRPVRDLVRGAQSVAEGLPPQLVDKLGDDGIVDKFQPDGLLIVRAGGEAGLFSAIIGGWPGQAVQAECQSVTREIRL